MPPCKSNKCYLKQRRTFLENKISTNTRESKQTKCQYRLDRLMYKLIQIGSTALTICLYTEIYIHLLKYIYISLDEITQCLDWLM